MPNFEAPDDPLIRGPIKGSAMDVIRGHVDQILESTPATDWLREENVARRMTQERERRGWSQERLSREMKRHGFALSQSSISKIENPPRGTARRAITVDEAVGLSVVLETPLLILMSPSGGAASHALEALGNGPKLAEQAGDAQAEFDLAVQQVATEYVNHSDQFGPFLANEARRLCEAAGFDTAPSNIEKTIRTADLSAVEPPARFQMTFLRAVLEAADKLKPRTRGPRKASK